MAASDVIGDYAGPIDGAMKDFQKKAGLPDDYDWTPFWNDYVNAHGSLSSTENAYGMLHDQLKRYDFGSAGANGVKDQFADQMMQDPSVQQFGQQVHDNWEQTTKDDSGGIGDLAKMAAVAAAIYFAPEMAGYFTEAGAAGGVAGAEATAAGLSSEDMALYGASEAGASGAAGSTAVAAGATDAAAPVELEAAKDVAGVGATPQAMLNASPAGATGDALGMSSEDMALNGVSGQQAAPARGLIGTAGDYLNKNQLLASAALQVGGGLLKGYGDRSAATEMANKNIQAAKDLQATRGTQAIDQLTAQRQLQTGNASTYTGGVGITPAGTRVLRRPDGSLVYGPNGGLIAGTAR